jgi:hypothetical protein
MMGPQASPNRRPRSFGLAAAVCLLLAAGCSSKEEEPRRAPPPPPAAKSKPGACSEGGGKIADAETAPLFPQSLEGFCLDPHGGAKSFGEGAALPIEKICDVFDGECEIYRGFNIRKLVEARYVDDKGSPATINVYLSKFSTTEGAYAMFTKRVVGDGDPADDSTPKPIAGGGAAALGLGNAYLWRGLYLAELTYNDEASAEAAIKAASDKLLPKLVAAMGEKMPGETQPPGAAALPKEDLLPLGQRYVTKDLLGVDGVGAGLLGYYKSGGKRYRVAALVRGDADQAKDTINTFAKLEGAAKEKYVADGAVRFMRKEGESPPIEWVFAYKGSTVLGIGDEMRVLKAGTTAEEHAKVSLTKDEKIEKLKRALK